MSSLYYSHQNFKTQTMICTYVKPSYLCCQLQTKPTDQIGTKNIHAITALNETVKQRKAPSTVTDIAT